MTDLRLLPYPTSYVLTPTAPYRITLTDESTRQHITRVLVVEDSQDFIDVLGAVLRRMGLWPILTANGKDALDNFDRQGVDLVLLDISLPDMTGWRVLDAIKERRGDLPRPAVIVMTAYGDPANKVMGKLQGVDAYLVKPFTPSQLQATIGRVLDTKAEPDTNP